MGYWGKLELTKCGYHIIYFDFEDSGIPTILKTPKKDSVQLKNQHGELIEIKAKNTYTPRKI